ncbi:MAG: AlpA family phage regulatory protein [Clostridia bacterium]|nr:AlpA family phage regulatory protein [Clostridia bacterium]MDE7079847.1 AlpA family phage regulatory protein [Clostridia bacterium]
MRCRISALCANTFIRSRQRAQTGSLKRATIYRQVKKSLLLL